MRYDLSGQWEIRLPDGREKRDGFLPGSLDENKVGDPDRVAKAWHPDIEDRSGEDTEFSDVDSRITTRLTRNYTCEGPAEFSRIFDKEVRADRRYYLHIERTRAASVYVDDEKAPRIAYGLSTPTVFDLTGILCKGSVIKLVTDNSYPGMPYRDITFSSAATDETQTNWNGAIGEIYIEEKNACRIEEVRVYPDRKDNRTISVLLQVVYDPVGIPSESRSYCAASRSSIDNDNPGASPSSAPISAKIRTDGTYLAAPLERSIILSPGVSCEVCFENITLTKECTDAQWDEYEGRLHELSVSLLTDNTVSDKKTVRFGLRTFSYDDTGRLTLNGRRIFLRSEANCGLFPETGHPPMVSTASASTPGARPKLLLKPLTALV